MNGRCTVNSTSWLHEAKAFDILTHWFHALDFQDNGDEGTWTVNDEDFCRDCSRGLLGRQKKPRIDHNERGAHFSCYSARSTDQDTDPRVLSRAYELRDPRVYQELLIRFSMLYSYCAILSGFFKGRGYINVVRLVWDDLNAAADRIILPNYRSVYQVRCSCVGHVLVFENFSSMVLLSYDLLIFIIIRS